jgi:hypothetical protein
MLDFNSQNPFPVKNLYLKIPLESISNYISSLPHLIQLFQSKYLLDNQWNIV